MNYDLRRALFAIAFVLFLFAVSFSCGSCSLVNPDSYGKKWENTYLWFSPEDPADLLVSGNGQLDTASPMPNGIAYQVAFTRQADFFKLEVSAYDHPVHALFFSGYPTKDVDEIQPWIEEDGSHILISDRLELPEDGYYRISLSEDLTK